MQTNVNSFVGFLKDKSKEEQQKIRDCLGAEMTYTSDDGDKVTTTKGAYIRLLLGNGAILKGNKIFELNSDTKKPKRRSTLSLTDLEVSFVNFVSAEQSANGILEDMKDEAAESGDVLENQPVAPTMENQAGVEQNAENQQDQGSQGIQQNQAAQQNQDTQQNQAAQQNQDTQQNQSRQSEEISVPEDTSAEQSDTKPTKPKKPQTAGNNKFEVWLTEQVKTYDNPQYEDILKQIFEQEIGEYDEHAKTLLVLIENFDNPECKAALKERLWSGNNASRKVFEHITGLALPITNADTSNYLELLTKQDFKGEKHYKPVEAAVHAEEKTYYICTNNKFEKVAGFAYPHPDLDLFIRYSAEEVIISDVKTGMLLAKGTNEQEASAGLAKNIKKTGIDKVKAILAGKKVNPIYLDDDDE